MRFPKNVINAFAVLGVVSFIVFACAAAEEAMSEDDPVVVNDPNDDTNNELPVMTVGKYQMVSYLDDRRTNDDDKFLVIMDTETGYTKSYKSTGSGNNWTLSGEQQLW